MRLIIITIALGLAACSTSPTRTVASGGAASATAPHAEPGTAAPVEGVPADTGTAPAAPPGPPTDVWLRIQASLQLDRHVDQAIVQDKMAWFERNQDFLDRVAQRAAPYLYYIVEELDRRRMPLDLALLPIIESAYHPFAVSPSRASGLWQFIPSTGKLYGLKQDWWYDGRRDIIAATSAALDYLQKLHDEFDGDWLLAVAAYNAGELNIARAVDRNRASGKDIDFWSLQLPRETRGYVPSLLAVAELVAHPSDHGVTWRPIANAPYFARVDLDGQLDLATAASLAGVGMDEIYTLNPGFKQWATDPDGPHYLLLPVASVSAFETGLRALPAEDRIQWTRHEVRPGESLGVIAAHYHTSIDALRSANKVRGNSIRAGNSLLIPIPQQDAGRYTLSEDTRRERSSGAGSAQDEASFRYVVARGDTLWEIGQRFDISVADLCRWNGIATDAVLRRGQELALRAPHAEPAALDVNLQTASADPVSYTVQRGDSLWQISRRFGVSVKQLQDWNRLARGARLQPGQIIVLYRANVAASGA